MKRVLLAILALMALAVLGSPASAMDAGAFPSPFNIPWANSATCGTPYTSNCYTAPVPQSSQIGIVNCAASLTDGFPPLTTVPAASGGCGPFIQDMNGIIKQLSQWAQWQTAGAPEWYSSAFSSAIGGYPIFSGVPDLFVGTGSISGTTLSITGVGLGFLAVGQTVAGIGVTNGTVITALGTGTGGIGTYTVNNSQSVISETLTTLDLGCYYLSNQDANANNPGSGTGWVNSCAVGGVLTGTLQNAGLAASGVTAGTYTNPTFTVGADGRVTSASSGSAANNPSNVGFTASSSGTALTINLTTASGATPSASSPVIIPFRSSTLATGTVTQSSVTAATSITIPSGATLQTRNSIAFRVWIFAVYNGGTPVLGVATCSALSGGLAQIFPCASWEYNGVAGTAISSSSNSAGVLYTTAGISEGPVRILGYCEYGTGLTSVGTWASTCTTLQVFDSGIKKPGDVIQQVFFQTSSAASNSTTTPAASNVVASISPSSAANPINVSVTGAATSGTTGQPIYSVIGQVYRGVSQTISEQEQTGVSGTGTDGSVWGAMAFDVTDLPNTTSSTTYSLYFWTSSSGHAVGINAGHVTLYEIMGMLDPANDNEPLRKVG